MKTHWRSIRTSKNTLNKQEPNNWTKPSKDNVSLYPSEQFCILKRRAECSLLLDVHSFQIFQMIHNEVAGQTFYIFSATDYPSLKSLLDRCSLHLMNTKKIKEQVLEDPNQWPIKEDVIYGFFLFFPKKKPIYQEGNSTLMLI